MNVYRQRAMSLIRICKHWPCSHLFAKVTRAFCDFPKPYIAHHNFISLTCLTCIVNHHLVPRYRQTIYHEGPYEVLVFPRHLLQRRAQTNAGTWEIVRSDMCSQRSLCISAVWSFFLVRMKKHLHPCLSEMPPLKSLIRLRECTGCS